ncbi:MAG TPA: carbohydrate ABC transporter permease, partial [Candidatus Avipropionibacterium avicola]|nr:carbohydrate ABC transporter permease [Candidatus Avipropionibacterium avicola]
MVKIQENRLSNGLIVAALVLVSVVAIVPLLAVVAISITPYGEVIRNGGYVFLPREVSFDSYSQILGHPAIRQALVVTTFVTVVGTVVNMVLTTLAAYPLCRHHDLPARRGLTLAFLFTFVFSAGIVPTFLVVQATGLVDTVWAMIIPNAISVFNVLIMKTFFDGLPTEIIEAARIDGASEGLILLRIILPLSIPVMLTLGLFYAVSHW